MFDLPADAYTKSAVFLHDMNSDFLPTFARLSARHDTHLATAVCYVAPQEGHLRIVLKGNLAGMLRLAQENKRPSEIDDLLDQVQVVAGASNQRYLQLWRGAA